MKHNFIYKNTLVVFILTLTILNCKEQKLEKKTTQLQEQIYGELNPNAPKETIQFGQLVGKWDVISSDSVPKIGWHESKALWTYKYALDGYAVEDVWYEKYSDSTSNTKNIKRNFMGKNLRIFDPNTKQWNITWVENGSNTMMSIITAKANSNGDIIMLSPNKSAQITFYNITNDHFDWKFELLKGEEKVLFSKMSANRLE